MTRAVFQLHISESDTAAATPAELTAIGEVDVTNVDDFMQSVLAVPGPRPIILILSGLKYLDSAGFAALDRLLEQNAVVLVLSPDSFMYRVAELMCLPIHHDTESARREAQEREAEGLEPDRSP